MKKIILSLALLLCVGSALGQTAEKLIAKYKEMPAASYRDITEEFKSKKDWNSKEAAKIARKVDGLQVVMVLLESEQRQAELQEDLDGLKGYEPLFDMKHNAAETPEDGPLSPTAAIKNVRLFVQEEKGTIRDLLMCVSIQELVFLVHVSGKLTTEELGALMAYEPAEGEPTIEINLNADKKDVPVVAVLIDGVFHSQLTDEKSAMDYLSEQGYLLDFMKVDYQPATDEDKRKYGAETMLVLKIDTSAAERRRD